jgi:hypothetical protein
LLGWVNAHKTAAVGVVVGAALVAAALVTRTSDTDGSAPAASSTVPAGESASASAAGATVPDDVTGAQEGSADRGDPSRLDFPMDPSGARRDRSEQGVRQVGLDYFGTVQQRFMYLAPSAGRELLDGWRARGVADAELERTVERFEALRSMLTAAGGDVWWVATPLAVRVEAFDPERARVSVWTATVTASGADPTTGGEVVVPIVDFRISTVELLWSVDAGWSVWEVSDVAGPVPMLAPQATQSAPAEFIARLDGFSLVKEHR